MLVTGLLFSMLVTMCLQNADKSTPLPGDQRVREMLRAIDQVGGEHKALILCGEQLFPTYIRILNDRDVGPLERIRIFSVLASLKGDRSQFLEHTIRHLSYSHNSVRHAAISLLAKIGTERDTLSVHALLSDADYTVGVAASKTIQAIGGPRDLAALNVWLVATNDQRIDPKYRQQYAILREYVTKARDGLKVRLDKEAQAKKPMK